MAEFDAHKVDRDEALPDDVLGTDQLDKVAGGATEHAEVPSADLNAQNT